MSTHKAEVVELSFSKHPNADKLSVAKIFDFSYVGNTEEWQGKTRAVYILPDTLVPVDRPEFLSLEGEAKDYLGTGRKYARIKAKKLRGIISFGLCVPVANDVPLGEDWYSQLELAHYEPELRTNTNGGGKGLVTGGEASTPPKCYFIKYDVENGRQYARQSFVEGEHVNISEKIHGANARYVFCDGEMFCGSLNEWKKEFITVTIPTKDELIERLSKRKDINMLTADEIALKADEIIGNLKLKNEKPAQNMWWKVLRENPELEQFCRNHPNYVVYGEVYGQIQNLTYNTKQGEIRFAAFDVMRPDGIFLDSDDFRATMEKHNVKCVPLIDAALPFNIENIMEIAERNSIVPGAESQISEGVVVKPLKERRDDRIGRVIVKFVSSRYLEKKQCIQK